MTGDFRLLGNKIEKIHEGQRIDAYLGRHFPFNSRSSWQTLIENTCVEVNGRTAKASYRLRFGDQLAHFQPLEQEPQVDLNVEVIWKQGAVLCAYKPSGLPMHEHGAFRRNTFSEVVKNRCGGEWAAVHRLDSETSGIVLCGATPKIRSLLSAQIESKGITKHYQALAQGIASADRWICNEPMAGLTDRYMRIKKVDPSGMAATTEFFVQENIGTYCKLLAIPHTGRTNQIRVHAAHCGLPLLGDKHYGTPEAASKHMRTCLHAFKISFFHPEIAKTIEVESAMPLDMADAWKLLTAELPSIEKVST